MHSRSFAVTREASAGFEAGTATGLNDSTLHSRILAEIEGRIVSGEWPPGHRLPFEVDLAAHYNCSRMTVNKVLAQLVRAGLIERRKKSGTVVTQPRAQSAILDIHDIKEEVQSLKLAYAYQLISRTRRSAGPDDMLRLGLSGATEVIDLRCLHFAGAKPFCLEERLISLATVPQAADFDFSSVAPGPFLLAQIPWTAAQHTIHAVNADREQAKRLELEARQACLVVERQTWAQAQPVTRVRFTYPGDRHMLTAHFQPTAGADF